MASDSESPEASSEPWPGVPGGASTRPRQLPAAGREQSRDPSPCRSDPRPQSNLGGGASPSREGKPAWELPKEEALNLSE